MSSSCRRRPFEYAPRPSGRYDSRAKASFAACHAIVRSSILLFTCEKQNFHVRAHLLLKRMHPTTAFSCISSVSCSSQPPWNPRSALGPCCCPPFQTVQQSQRPQHYSCLHFLPKQQYCNRVGPQNFQFHSSRKKRSTHKTEIAKTMSNKPISK